MHDDNPEILLVCKTILEQRRYQVKTRIFWDHVINDINEVKPRIILLELWIPTIGGEQATTLIKKNSKTNYIPVIPFFRKTRS